MNKDTALSLISGAITDFGVAVLTVVSATLVLGLGYLVYKFGISRLLHDQSLMIGGFYVRNTPYKGYNRWRSREWNMKHTM